MEVVIDGKTYRGYEVTRQFVQTALSEQADLPPPTRCGRGQWNRDLTILERYVQTGVTLQQLGHDFYLTREGVRVVVSRTIRQLWLRCPPLIQSLFPLSELSTRKPESGQRISIGLSRVSGGRSIKIAEMLQQEKSWPEIKESLGLRWSELKASREIVSRWGLVTPELPTPTPIYQKLASQLTDPAKTDMDIQQILAQISPHIFDADQHHHPPLLITMARLLREMGFHYWTGQGQMQQFVDILTAKNIPVGKVVKTVRNGPQQGPQRYRFIAAIHRERARQVLESDLTLQPFRHYSVQQVAGPDYPAPSVYRLQNRQSFVSCGSILAELGIGVAGRSRIRQRDFWTNDCPVPVFCNKRIYYCSKTEAEALKSFIQRKLLS